MIWVEVFMTDVDLINETIHKLIVTGEKNGIRKFSEDLISYIDEKISKNNLDGLYGLAKADRIGFITALIEIKEYINELI
jgi:hypothetical protein